MEIHPSHEPVLTWRQAAVQLAIITAGILIALSFEGIVAWWDHRALTNEARANLLSEIADNRKEIAGSLANLPNVRTDLDAMAGLVRTLAASTPPTESKLRLNYQLAEPGSASRTTAEATGAFGYMEYAEVKEFAAVYDLQDVFTRTQDRVAQDLLAAYAPVQILQTPAVKPTPQDLEDWQRRIRTASSSMIAVEQIGGALVKAYDEVLAKHRE